jgi:hypothetical protein
LVTTVSDPAYGDADFSFADTSPLETDAQWRRVLAACKSQLHIGFGLLDSFLSRPDLDRRINLVVAETATNEWLRDELRDTLSLDQSHDMSPEQVERLRGAAGWQHVVTQRD